MNAASYLRRMLCVLLLATLAHANEAAMVEVKFVSLPVTPDMRTALLQVGDDQTIEVELPSNHLSQAYMVPKRDNWVLGRSGKDQAGEAVFKPIGSTPAVEGAHQLIVVLHTDAGDDSKVELFTIDHRQAGASFHFINATSHEISGELDVERFSISPKGHAMLSPAASKVMGERKFCDVAFSYTKDGEVIPFFNSLWKLSDQVGSLILFHEEAGKLRMQSILEILE